MINLLITFISYLLIPLLIMILNRNWSYKKRNTMCVIYCCLVCLAWQIVGYYLIDNYKIKFTSGFFYYGILIIINSLIPIRKSENEKYNDEEVQNKHSNYKLKPKKITIFILIISLLINFISISSIFIICNRNEKQKYAMSKEINKLKKESKNLENEENENREFLTSRISELYAKSSFYDKYIVIVPNGSRYYYSYDCWNKNGKSDNFNIMNYKQAQSLGYIKQNC